MPIVSAPPPAKRTPTATEKKTVARANDRADALKGFGQLFQLPLLITGQHADAGALAMHWPNIATEIANLAETQPAIAKLVDPLMQAGPYAGLIAAVLPLVVQIGVNHGKVQAGAMGTVPAASLDAQVKAGLAKAELAALRAQQEAEKEARAIKAEIESARSEAMAA